MFEFVCSGEHVEDLRKFLLPEFAIVGRSNVGKSSLVNMISAKKQLARTSHTPGRTQTINLFKGPHYSLADLPGYGFAKVSKTKKETWSGMMESYFDKRENLLGVLFLFDARRDATEEDLMLVNWFHDLNLEVVIVLTKIDKITSGQWPAIIKKNMETFSVQNVVLSSSHSKKGRDEILSELFKLSQKKSSER